MDPSAAAGGGGGGGGLLGTLIPLAIMIFMLVSMWKVFTKAGEPGWAIIIPFFNLWVLVRISGKDWWWFILFFIPLINIIASILVSLGVAEKFGKGAGFGIGLWLLPFIFYPILAFGDAQHQG